jgi:Thioredoxin like C-terminal domain
MATSSCLSTGGQSGFANPAQYQLIRQPKPIADRHFEIEFLEAGLEAFVFTFG